MIHCLPNRQYAWSIAIMMLLCLISGCKSIPDGESADPGKPILFDPIPPVSVQTESLRDVRLRRFAPVEEHVASEWTKEPSIWPVEHPERQVISRFGPRGQKEHKGMDIKAPTGTPIMAAADGEVTYAGTRSGYGLVVEISHGDGVGTVYGHMNEISVALGDVVQQGDPIGTVGATGNASTPHLHYEVLIDGEIYDPWLFLPAIQG
jgi:murein DD-endopeptidase MepM/ murein hydrolase activator NlpD